jgi:flagella basal body P-ring formation protein FlgA
VYGLSDSVNNKCLETLIKEGNVEAVMRHFDRLQNSVAIEQQRYQNWAADQTIKLKQQLTEKDATIAALIKCIRLLGGE